MRSNRIRESPRVSSTQPHAGTIPTRGNTTLGEFIFRDDMNEYYGCTGCCSNKVASPQSASPFLEVAFATEKVQRGISVDIDPLG